MNDMDRNDFHKAIIMMATYNGEKYISKQIDSIIEQTYTDWVLLISDNGSTDSTPDIIRDYVFSDKRIKYIGNCKVKGAYNNFFYLISYVKKYYKDKYDFFFYVDQDDIWLPNKVELEVIQLLSYDIPALCFTDVEFIDGEGKSFGINASDLKSMGIRNQYDYLFEFKYVLGTSMAHNKRLWELIQVPDIIEGDIIRHDQYIRKYAAVYGKLIYINTPLVKYRRHDNNVSSFPVNYGFISGMKKFITKYDEIKDHVAKHMCAALLFIDYTSEFKEVLVDFQKAILFGGRYVIYFLHKYDIKISDNLLEHVCYELIMITGVYKKRMYNYYNARKQL